jgi:hypothetical protein
MHRCSLCRRELAATATWKGRGERFYCSEFCAESEEPDRELAGRGAIARRATMRAIITQSSLIAVMLMSAAGAAPGQSLPAPNGPSVQTSPAPMPQPPATEGRSTIPQAPIGHRQPTQRDVGRDVLQREERPALRDPYQLPSICRGC